MGDGVDTRCVGVSGVVADAEGEVAKSQAALAVTDEAEDHAELAVRWRQVDLEAGWELCAVAAFGVAAPQPLDFDAFALKLAARIAKRFGSGTTASHRVLGEGTLVEEDAGMTPPDEQGLPLAVCRQERPVLGL